MDLVIIFKMNVIHPKTTTIGVNPYSSVTIIHAKNVASGAVT